MRTFVLLLLMAIGGVTYSAEDCSCLFCKQHQPPACCSTQVTTERFVVRCYCGNVDAQTLARHASHLHATLAKRWLQDDSPTWTPRCEVVVHANRASYLRSVGADGAATLGSTLVRFSQGKVAVRRIDLLADEPSRPFETIGHELVHVLFAERFPKAAPPRWAEEGAALLADTDCKRTAHQRDFALSLRNGSAFRVIELVRMHDYPPPTRFAAFYGQSLVLVDFLMHLGEPADFVQFVDRSMAIGHDAALREVYGIASAADLEELWRERAVKTALAVN